MNMPMKPGKPMKMGNPKKAKAKSLKTKSKATPMKPNFGYGS